MADGIADIVAAAKAGNPQALTALAHAQALGCWTPRNLDMALDNLARIYVETRRYELAADALTTLAERDHEDRHDAWFQAGEIYDKRLKDMAHARAAYARVPPESPRYGEAQKRLRK